MSKPKIVVVIQGHSVDRVYIGSELAEVEVVVVDYDHALRRNPVQLEREATVGLREISSRQFRWK